MDRISSRWRKPKSRSSKKRNIAAVKAMARWKKTKSNNSVCQSTSVIASDVPLLTSDIDSGVNSGITSLNVSTSNLNTTVKTERKKTRSEVKLTFFEKDSVHIEQGSAYTFVHDSMWNDLLQNLMCQKCYKKELTVNNVGEFGYSTKLQLNCASCNETYGSTFSSPRLSEMKRFEINKSMVEAFLKLGKGHSAMETFSMTLGIQTMDRKTFDKCVLHLVEENKFVRANVLEMAREKVREEHKIFDSNFCEESGILDIAVSYDGTWQKRGYSSLYGIGCVIDMLTGLVIDFEVMSKYCHDCTKTAADLGEHSAEFSIWHKAHKDLGSCEKNYEGSSGSMEVHAAKVMWQRSIENCKMRYTVVLSDGDSKAYQNLTASKIYETEDIVKEECINHVSKRLGTALRNKVKEWRTKGICLGGRKKGNLTENVIVKLTNYYRKAIKINVSNIKEMKTAIFASLFHCMSTNRKPQHQKCPSGTESWCFYNRALALGTRIPNHEYMKTKLSEDVVAKILPVYQRLASDELLKRCTLGKTQNSNESLHSIIWKYCPKDTFVSKKRIELAATFAISDFNMGCVASLTAKETDSIRSPSLSIAKKRDQRRLKQSLRRDTLEYKNACRNKKFLKNKKEKKQTKKEGVSYAAGSF